MLEVISRNYEIENYFWRFVKICGNSDCFWKFVNICGNSDCKAAHREEKKETYISICQPKFLQISKNSFQFHNSEISLPTSNVTMGISKSRQFLSVCLFVILGCCVVVLFTFFTTKFVFQSNYQVTF
jgi:hypothetical protein